MLEYSDIVTQLYGGLYEVGRDNSWQNIVQLYKGLYVVARDIQCTINTLLVYYTNEVIKMSSYDY